MWKRCLKYATICVSVPFVSSFLCCILFSCIGKALGNPKWLDPFCWVAFIACLASYPFTFVLILLLMLLGYPDIAKHDREFG